MTGLTTGPLVFLDLDCLPLQIQSRGISSGDLFPSDSDGKAVMVFKAIFLCCVVSVLHTNSSNQ